MKVTTSMCDWRTAYLCRLASTGTASTHPGVRMESPIFPGRRSSQASPLTTNSRPCRRAHAGCIRISACRSRTCSPRETSAIKSGMQEIVIFLEDFSRTNSQTLFDNLRKPKSGGMDMKATAMDMSKPDLNDVDYDAYLANERTLADPDVIDVEGNGEVRLRIANPGASTNFTIDLRAVEGTLVAVDGNPIVPLKARQFPLAVPARRHRAADACRRERRSGARPWRGAALADGRRASTARRGRGEDFVRRLHGGA